jgi:hypothetical protein
MRRLDTSTAVFAGLILLQAVVAGIFVFLPQGSLQSAAMGQKLPAAKPVVAAATFGLVLILYGGLGYLGMWCARKLGFADVWDPAVSNRQRFLIPALAGVALGIFFIVADSLFSHFHDLGPIPHPPFPTSLAASLNAGIGEEVLFRLFFIGFWMWLVAHVLLKSRPVRPVFWLVTAFSALFFSAAHVPSLMMLFGLHQFAQLPGSIIGELLLLNGVLSVVAAIYLRSFGLLAAIGVHFWTDVVWHVIWGAL